VSAAWESELVCSEGVSRFSQSQEEERRSKLRYLCHRRWNKIPRKRPAEFLDDDADVWLIVEIPDS
jgi:hypothetical protein